MFSNRFQAKNSIATVLATPISQIDLASGSAIRISGVTWESHIALLQKLGDDLPTHVAYKN